MAECPTCGYQNEYGRADCPGCVEDCPDGFTRPTNLVCGWDQARRSTAAIDPLVFRLGIVPNLPKRVSRAASASPGGVLHKASDPTARYRRRGSGSCPPTRERGGWRVRPREQPPEHITTYCLSMHDLESYGAENAGNCDRCRAQYIDREKIFTCAHCLYQGEPLFYCERCRNQADFARRAEALNREREQGAGSSGSPLPAAPPGNGVAGPVATSVASSPARRIDHTATWRRFADA